MKGRDGRGSSWQCRVGKPKGEKGLARTMKVRQGRWIWRVLGALDSIEKCSVSMVQYINVKLFAMAYKSLCSLEPHDSPTPPAFSPLLTLVQLYWPPCCSLHRPPGLLLPQCLCICHSFCLKHSPPKLNQSITLSLDILEAHSLTFFMSLRRCHLWNNHLI